MVTERFPFLALAGCKHVSNRLGPSKHSNKHSSKFTIRLSLVGIFKKNLKIEFRVLNSKFRVFDVDSNDIFSFNNVFDMNEKNRF